MLSIKKAKIGYPCLKMATAPAHLEDAEKRLTFKYLPNTSYEKSGIMAKPASSLWISILLFLLTNKIQVYF